MLFIYLFNNQVLVKLVDPSSLGLSQSNVLARAFIDLNQLLLRPYPPGFINLYGNQSLSLFEYFSFYTLLIFIIIKFTMNLKEIEIKC